MKYEDTWGDKYKPLYNIVNAYTDLKTFDENIKKLKAGFDKDLWWEWIPHLKREELIEDAKIELCERIGYVEPIIKDDWLFALMYGSDCASYNSRIEMYNLVTGEYKCKNVNWKNYPMMYLQQGY